MAEAQRQQDAVRPGDDPSAQEIKQAAQEQWAHDPAGGLGAGDEELGTPESFRRVERYRYAEQPWMHDTFHFERYADCDVLEIGVGLGTDHLQFARAGARLTGIDLTPRCIELSRARFEQEGLHSDLRIMDAERLEFADDSFDVVYSFGVLHHTASAERAFTEVRRVLRPGGAFIGALYNRHSLVTAGITLEYFLKRQFREESFRARLSRVEYSTASDRPKPFVRLFAPRELTSTLNRCGFSEVRLTRRHSGWPLKPALPKPVDALVARTAGWYLVHTAL